MVGKIFGRERPERGSPLHIVVDDVSLASQAGASSETELVAEVPLTRLGRRARLPLGAQLRVSWGWHGQVRTRDYRLLEVRAGGVAAPTWRLTPLAPALEGTRRAVPRYQLSRPVVLATDSGRLAGETVDLSVAGVRMRFPASDAAQPAPLPEPGTSGEMIVLVDDERVCLPVEVVRAATAADGSRDVRVFLDPRPGYDIEVARGRLRDLCLQSGVEMDDVPPPTDIAPPAPAPDDVLAPAGQNEEPVRDSKAAT